MPTINRGMVISFEDTVGIKRDVSDFITMLDPYDVPLLRWMPGLKNECTNTKHEWIEDSLVPVSSVLNGAVDDQVGTVTVNVAAGTGGYFLPDDLIKIDDEVMLVTAVNTDALTVQARPFGNQTRAGHLDGAVVTRVGVAKREGADAGEPRYTDKTADYNYTQIFEETVKVSGTREAISQYGVTNEYAYQLSKVLKQRAILVEQALMHGTRYEDTTNERRTMGGLLEFCSVNPVNANGAELTKAMLDSMTQEIWRAGGSPRTMIMNIDQKERLFSFYENQIRRSQGDTTVGGYITSFENSLGRFDVLLDRWCPRDTIMFIDRDLVGFGPLSGRNWSHTYLGKKGDYRHGQVLGEFTMEVRGKAAHGIISNLAI